MILLSRAYDGYLAGTIIQLSTSLEAALVAQGIATVSAGPVTPGPVNAGGQSQGRVGIAAAQASLTVACAGVTTESKVTATIAQAAADGTALYIARVVCANGSFTIYPNAAPTAALTVDWSALNPAGLTVKN